MKSNQKLNILFDKGISCSSIIINMSISEYISIIDDAYIKNGGLSGQRTPLKTSTAIRIRNRMIEDLEIGAILPPVVIGVIVDIETMEELSSDINNTFDKVYDEVIKTGKITIVDGIQRSTAIFEALNKGNLDKNSQIRVEFWITNSVNSIIYRMLVLNSGQIPWNIKRQLEVIFSPLIEKLQQNVQNLLLIKIDDTSKRSKAGSYQANQFVELYLNFGTRKENLDIEDALTQEFTKLDLIQVTANKNFTDMFIQLAGIFVNLDSAFSRYNGHMEDDAMNTKFKNGKSIFSSHPARVGFFVACAKNIIGIPGIEKKPEDQEKNARLLFDNLNQFITRINSMTNDELGIFLKIKDIDLVITGKRTGKVGEYERAVFLKAFECLIEYYIQLDNMYPCWRAYQ